MSISNPNQVEIGVLGQGNLADLIIEQLGKVKFSLNMLEDYASSQVCISGHFYNSPMSLAMACPIIITIMSDGPELENVLFGNQGVVHCRRTDSIVIDMSPVSPEFLQELSEQLIESEISFLDAVVINENVEDSGTIQMMLVGGESSIYDRVLPIFEKISKNVKHIGVNGASQFYRQAFVVREKN